MELPSLELTKDLTSALSSVSLLPIEEETLVDRDLKLMNLSVLAVAFVLTPARFFEAGGTSAISGDPATEGARSFSLPYSRPEVDGRLVALGIRSEAVGLPAPVDFISLDPDRLLVLDLDPDLVPVVISAEAMVLP